MAPLFQRIPRTALMSLRSTGRVLVTMVLALALTAGALSVPELTAPAAAQSGEAPDLSGLQVRQDDRVSFTSDQCKIGQNLEVTLPDGYSDSDRTKFTSALSKSVEKYDSARPGVTITDPVDFGPSVNLQILAPAEGVSAQECQQAGNEYIESPELDGILAASFWRKLAGVIAGAVAGVTVGVLFSGIVLTFPEAAVPLAAIDGCLGGGVGSAVSSAVLGIFVSKLAAQNAFLSCIGGTIVGAAVGGVLRTTMYKELKALSTYIRANGGVRRVVDNVMQRLGGSYENAVQMALRA